MCSNCSGDYEDPEMTAEPDELTDALGTDLLQATLAVSYSRYILNSTRNLIDYVYGYGSPLVGVRKL